MTDRISTGNDAIDEMLGGGLLRGTLTVVFGATGIGKTQLGLNYLCGSSDNPIHDGALLDLSARGDSQNHAGYAKRLFDKNWTAALPAELHPDSLPAGADHDWVFDQSIALPDALTMLGYGGSRIVRDQLDSQQWDAWQRQVNRHLTTMVSFLYAHLLRGARRFVIDGIEPLGRPEDSLQMDLFEYAYHRVIRREYDWVARDLLRQSFRRLSDQVEANRYDHAASTCLLLCTTPDSMLDALMDRPLADGDLAATANTLIYMGKIRDGLQMRRGIHIAKHRGSKCDDGIRLFDIDDQGLQVL